MHKAVRYLNTNYSDSSFCRLIGLINGKKATTNASSAARWTGNLATYTNNDLLAGWLIILWISSNAYVLFKFAWCFINLVVSRVTGEFFYTVYDLHGSKTLVIGSKISIIRFHCRRRMESSGSDGRLKSK